MGQRRFYDSMTVFTMAVTTDLFKLRLSLFVSPEIVCQPSGQHRDQYFQRKDLYHHRPHFRPCHQDRYGFIAGGQKYRQKRARGNQSGGIQVRGSHRKPTLRYHAQNSSGTDTGLFMLEKLFQRRFFHIVLDIFDQQIGHKQKRQSLQRIQHGFHYHFDHLYANPFVTKPVNSQFMFISYSVRFCNSCIHNKNHT